ncbi:hypothetical protein GCM10015535_59190 [Streptomyces gelaticus]|uniref:Uncharacterized protein n=1 Tax=Streptomyces gelaticus TaxID=285446 RepID=A0ABQ2W6M9_9ACTN|nr:hypothetical protein GCM10015535_59190 [Streptomyces gelaticus]
MGAFRPAWALYGHASQTGRTVSALPAQLRRSLAWDQGSEMHLDKDFSIATDGARTALGLP